jgi:glutathionyl-hydroquinone reductase
LSEAETPLQPEPQVIRSVCPVELVEIKDGLLVSQPDKTLIKVRCPELFPGKIKKYFDDKNKICKNKIEIGIEKVIIKDADRKAVFNSDFFDYFKSLGKMEYYLSNVKLPCEDGDYYPLLAKYRYGWVMLSPLEA